MFRLLGGVAALALAGCISTPEPNEFWEAPSKWSPDDVAKFQRASPTVMCQTVNAGLGKTPGWSNSWGKLAAKDRAILSRGLRSKGFNARDIEILLAPSASYTYGTGMSFAGLECATNGGVIIANDAFYPGIGHQWQAKYGSDYIYLRGDGTEEGMRVHAWN